MIVKRSMPSFQLKIFILRSPEPRKGFKITFCIYAVVVLLSLCGSNSSVTAIGPISLRFPHNM